MKNPIREVVNLVSSIMWYLETHSRWDASPDDDEKALMTLHKAGLLQRNSGSGLHVTKRDFVAWISSRALNLALLDEEHYDAHHNARQEK